MARRALIAALILLLFGWLIADDVERIRDRWVMSNYAGKM